MKYLKTKLSAEVVVADKFVGNVDFADGIADITDPCYESDVWCAVFGKKIKAGEYAAYITVIDYPHMVQTEDALDAMQLNVLIGEKVKLSDKRIMSVKIVHKDFVNAGKRWQMIATSIGVDAGLCGFYNHKPDFKSDDLWGRFCDSLEHFEDTYCVCDIKPYGITVSSGFGDGVYRLYAQKAKGEIVALELRFN